MSSFKLPFVYLMSEDADWISDSYVYTHEDLNPHTLLEDCFLVVHCCKVPIITCHRPHPLCVL